MLRHFGFKEEKHTLKFVEKKAHAYCADKIKQ